MNKEEIIDKIVEMSKEIKKLKEELNGQEKPSKRWKPEFHGKNYCIDSTGMVSIVYWEDWDVDKRRYALGNCFKTAEEAEFAIEQLKVLAELKEYADDDREWGNSAHYPHYLIYCDTSCNEIAISSAYTYITSPFNIYFSSEEQAQKAIDTIGEGRLKKYYFCVEE